MKLLKTFMGARNRRILENKELESLAKYLPLASAITSQLDKATIVRLTTAYLALRNLFPHVNNDQVETMAIGSFLLQTLDGFALILDTTGKLMYVSETASVHLGLSQVELIGSSIYDFLHHDDEPELKHILTDTGTDSSRTSVCGNDRPYTEEIERMFFIRLKCVLPKRNAGIIYNGYKTISCWGCSKVYHHGEMITNMGLAAVGYMLTRSGITELKLSSSTFMFRAHLDLSLIFVDSRVTALTGFAPTSLLDTTLYQMVLLEDGHIIEKAHRIMLQKNQSTTGYYRLMHRTYGYVWAQSHFCIISVLRAVITHCVVAVTEIFSKREDDMTLATIQMDVGKSASGCTFGKYTNLFQNNASNLGMLYVNYGFH